MKIMNTGSFDIRYSQASDLLFLNSWVSQQEVMDWLPISNQKEMDMATSCWIGFAKFKSSLTATIDHTPCGMATIFLMPYKKVAHHAMFKIVVNPAMQHQGVGTALLKNIKHLARSYFKMEFLYIEVMDKNPIISLLLKQGFKQLLFQEDYFKDGQTLIPRIVFEVNLMEESI